MIATIFIVLFISVLIAWFGRREESIYLFAAAMLFAFGTFIHHITDVIGLSL